ncbi:hypothetical protein N1031_15855 [Herbiconiux moechotypicola]|uniref:DUF11 domain-containing protein n=1 Tax=Herbiconiux moechotypicola TaxID=637393 RepID=A0ABN3DYM6_9MICO|nr:hypothetical protein [Herbiconiux moechotypicola]MCS5731240.1 hypothetical protein [Herbiconiux moechotypicola]
MVDPVTRRSADATRRTVLTGAVWSLPVLAVAVATPSASASTQLGRLAIETVGGGTWVDPESGYYGVTVQLRNNADFATAEPITSVVLTVTLAPGDVSDPPVPVVIANQGGSSPTVNLPTTDPTWTAGTAFPDGDGDIVYTLSYSGSIAAQTGVCNVSFGIQGPASGLVSPLTGTIVGVGTPSDGFTPSRTGTIY